MRYWLLAAGLLHLAFLVGMPTAENAPLPETSDRKLATELEVVDWIGVEPTVEPSAPSAVSRTTVAKPVAAVERSRGKAPEPEAPAGAKLSAASEAATQEMAVPDDTVPSPSVEANPLARTKTKEEPQRVVVPGLSLGQLGVGEGNPFLQAGSGAMAAGAGGQGGGAGWPAAVSTGAVAVAERRLRKSLQQGLLEQDQALGLGPEGPVVEAVRELTYAAADTAANGESRIRVKTDSEGRVFHVELLSASANTSAWERIVAELLRELSSRRLSTKGRGVTIELDIVSREQLPSGRAPGVAVKALGIPLKKGRGDNASSIDILSPGLTELDIPGTDGRSKILVPSLQLLALNFDPTDIGAPARRMVQVKVHKVEVH